MKQREEVKKPNIVRRLYDWTLRWSKTPNAVWALFGLSFAESSFFPIPPDVLLIAMTIAERKKWAYFALITTLGSLSGAVLGYFIGWGLYETVGQPIVEFYNLQEGMNALGASYKENAFLAVFGAAFTPIPYKIITISAGLFKISLAQTLIASAVGRTGRFFIVAGLLRLFGKPIEKFIDKYFNLLSLLFFVLLILGFWALKVL